MYGCFVSLIYVHTFSLSLSLSSSFSLSLPTYELKIRALSIRFRDATKALTVAFVLA